MHFLPQTYPSLQETGFYVGGFNRVTDYFIIPFGMGLTKEQYLKSSAQIQKLFAKLLHWGLKTFSKPPFVTMLLCEANGRKNNKEKTIEIKLYHRDGYFLTAAPVVACLLQVFNEEIGEPGLWFQANIVHTGRFFEDMKTMGIQISIKNNF
ncbi:MAG: hypothetical protein ACE5GL_04135 [Calditrichia bacterium]